jgi:hypothetical protein
VSNCHRPLATHGHRCLGSMTVTRRGVGLVAGTAATLLLAAWVSAAGPVGVFARQDFSGIEAKEPGQDFGPASGVSATNQGLDRADVNVADPFLVTLVGFAMPPTPTCCPQIVTRPPKRRPHHTATSPPPPRPHPDLLPTDRHQTPKTPPRDHHTATRPAGAGGEAHRGGGHAAYALMREGPPSELTAPHEVTAGDCLRRSACACAWALRRGARSSEARCRGRPRG